MPLSGRREKKAKYLCNKDKMKICCLFNIAPRYRAGIYRRMDDDPTVEYDFLAGEESTGGIALLDMRELKGFRGYLRNIYRKSGKLVWQRRAIRKAFSRRYDAYILTGNPGIRSNWIIALVARLLGRPVYLWTHGLYGDERGLKLWKNLAYFRLAGRLLLYGNRARRLLFDRGFPDERMSVIYNSLDYDRHRLLRERIGDRGFIRNYFGNELPLLSFVGRLTEVKRLDLLLDAMARLDRTGAPCNLVLVGDGPQRDALIAQAEALGLTDRVWFYGESYDEHLIGTFLYHSAACVSPGNVGLTAIHALTFGTPVVTHGMAERQMPEFEAIQPGVTGCLFEAGDASSLAEAIRPWLAATDAERVATREACHAVIDKNFNPGRQMELLQSIFACPAH